MNQQGYLVEWITYEDAAKRLFAELDMETERGCVVLAASFLDDVIKRMVRYRLQRGGLEQEDIDFLLERKGALMRSNSVRMNYLKHVGVLDDRTVKALEEVASLRNECAHLLDAKKIPSGAVDKIYKQIDRRDTDELESCARQIVEMGGEGEVNFYRAVVPKISHRGQERVRFTLAVAWLFKDLRARHLTDRINDSFNEPES